MIVELSASKPPEIVDRDRVDRLHAVSDGPLGDVVLEPTCRLADDDHVWVLVTALRDACAPEVGADAFDGMIAYASSKGWLDEVGEFVRAHVEPGDV